MDPSSPPRVTKFLKYIEAWLEACADTPDTPCVTEGDEHSLPSNGTRLGVTDIHDVIGCHTKSDSLTTKSTTENTSSGYRNCTDATGQYKVDGTLVMLPRGEILSTLIHEIKVQSNIRHTSDWLPPHPLTRAGIIAKPPEESIRTKPVVVEPTSVSQFDINDCNASSSTINSSHLPDVENPSLYQVGSSRRLTDTHIRSRRDAKGKLPIGTTQLVMTKCTPTIPPIYVDVDRHDPCGRIDPDSLIRIACNQMFEKILIHLHKINQHQKQFTDEVKVIIDHDWPGYLEHIRQLEIDPDPGSIQPVVDTLTGCIHQHHTKSCRLVLYKIQTLLEETYHNIMSISKEINIKEVFITSLQTFTNYIKHTFQPETTTVENESPQCSSPVLSEAMVAKLLDYSYISSQNSDSLHCDSAGVDHNTGSRRRNRKSRKDRHKNIHDARRCVIPDCFSCAKENVVNLTNRPLNRQQITLLSKGLSFIPSTPESDARELSKDLGEFISNVKIKCGKLLVKSQRNKHSKKRRINNNSNNTTNSLPHFEEEHCQRKQTDWPSNRLLSSQMENTFHAMRMELASLADREFNNPKNHSHNLTRKEHNALDKFKKTSSLVFKKGDKTTCIVVKTRKDYIREGMIHLSDTRTYLRLDRDYTPDVVEHIKYTLQQYKRGGLLSDHMVRQCMPKTECRTALLYFLTKTHKSPMTLRPIVSQVGSATGNMATFLDHYLQPIVKSLPAYLKDSTQFIREVTELPLEPDDILVTVDVKSLYTNIPTPEGLEACYRAWLNSEMNDPQQPPAETLRHILEMVLKLNVLEFNRKYYLQTFGTSMGASFAPSYANIFMGSLEQSMLENARVKPKYYRRFIDDIFMIVNCNETQLEELITHMNQQNASIKFTHEYSKEEITFLDVTVYRDLKRSDKLQVKTFIKPTNKQLYISNSSYHPPGATRGVAFGEALRYLRTNSDKRQFYKMMFLHKRNLLKRGYPKSLINETIRKVKFSMREKLMQPRISKQKVNEEGRTPERPTFVTRYCSRARKVFRIVQRYWSSLQSDHTDINKYIRNKPMLTYRSNQSLANKLVRARLKTPHNKHNFKHNNTVNSSSSDNNGSLNCSSSNRVDSTCTNNTDIASLANIKHNVDIGLKISTNKCKDLNCPLHGTLRCTNQARSNISKRAYITRGIANCNTKCVVYLLQCRNCGRQYVGQTGQSLKDRFKKHLKKIGQVEDPNTAVHDHFRKGACRGIHNILVQVLHVLDPTHLTREQTEDQLKAIELLWIDRLMSGYPQGLNYIRNDQIKRYMHYK